MVSLWSSVSLSVYLSYISLSVFLFWDLSTFQWIFTKLVKCTDTVKVWSGIANEHILSIFDCYLPETHLNFSFQTILESVSVDFHQTW